eukprot:5939767-Amphidinium_carterae.1
MFRNSSIRGGSVGLLLGFLPSTPCTCDFYLITCTASYHTMNSGARVMTQGLDGLNLTAASCGKICAEPPVLAGAPNRLAMPP